MKTVAIVGATGLVGEKMLQVLERNNFAANYLLFAGKRSAGRTVEFANKRRIVLDVATAYEHSVDYALFMSTAEVAQNYVPVFVANGATVIDNSSHFRMREDVPLIVDEINGDKAAGHSVIANPNCTTIQLVLALNALKKFGLKRVVADTYQAVSGAGKHALEDLRFKANYGNLKGSLHPVYDNVVPQIDDFCENGYTKEEMKVVCESRKILDMPSLAVNCTAVRVPVSVGHSIAVTVELEESCDAEKIKKAFAESPCVALRDDTAHNVYPMPIVARGTNEVYVGRVRKDLSQANSVSFFVTADNLLRGAAYNAFEILRRLTSGS